MNSEKGNTFPARVKIISELVGGANELARLVNVSRRTIGFYLSGETDPSRETLVSMARHAGVEPGWLVTGEGPMRKGEVPAIPEAVPSDQDATSFPLYDVSACMGNGTLNSTENIERMLIVSADFVRKALGLQPKSLCAVHMSGDSMEPTLSNGTMAFVNRDVHTIQADGIFIIRLDSLLMVKRLQSLPGKQVKVSSDNPAYDSFVLTPDDPPTDFAILGRVIGFFKRL